MMSGDLEESACTFGLAEYFRLNGFDQRELPVRTCQVGFLLEIPQVISHLAQLLVVVVGR